MPQRTAHRWTVLTASTVLLLSTILSLGTAASATTTVERVEGERREAAAAIADLRAVLHDEVTQRRQAVTLAQLVQARGGHVMPAERWTQILEFSQRHARVSERLQRRVADRIDALIARRDRLADWLDRLVFRVCPVDAFTQIYDDFGEMVRLPKVPVHRHEGVDITAPTGSPIRAPFDGYASSSWGELGGLSVRVEGERGYVYNAHLVTLGNLGWVKAGTIVGYVGSTGDATAPHDHIEWHPWGGPAVDPYPLVALACLPA